MTSCKVGEATNLRGADGDADRDCRDGARWALEILDITDISTSMVETECRRVFIATCEEISSVFPGGSVIIGTLEGVAIAQSFAAVRNESMVIKKTA